jgi:DNA-binding CsgD family transcriptional regulator
MGQRGRPRHPDILTPREWEVLALVREGRTNDQIAETLGITLATARFHVSEIIGKLGVSNRHEAAAWEPKPERSSRPCAPLFAPFAALRYARWSHAAAAVAFLVIGAALVLVALLGWGVSRTTSPPSALGATAICTPSPTSTPITPGPKLPSTPDLRPDATREAEISQGQLENSDWSRRFIASGCDAHSLARFGIEQFAGNPYVNPDQVVAHADVIVRAHVDRTTFTVTNDSLPPRTEHVMAHALLRVVETLKGEAPPRIEVDQMGGPVGGELEEVQGQPVLLGGDEVILLAYQSSSSAGARLLYRPLNYVGVYYVRDGRVYAPKDNPCATSIDGSPLKQATDFIRAVLKRIATGPVSSVATCGAPLSMATQTG